MQETWIPLSFSRNPILFNSVFIWNNTMGTWFKVVISPYQMKKSKSSLFSSERIKGGLTTRRGAGHKNTRKVKLPVMFWLGLFNCLLDVGLQFWTVLFHAHFLFLQQKWILIIRPVLPCCNCVSFFVKMLLLSCFLFSNTICLKIVGKISLFNKKKKQ